MRLFLILDELRNYQIIVVYIRSLQAKYKIKRIQALNNRYPNLGLIKNLLKENKLLNIKVLISSME